MFDCQEGKGEGEGGSEGGGEGGREEGTCEAAMAALSAGTRRRPAEPTGRLLTSHCSQSHTDKLPLLSTSHPYHECRKKPPFPTTSHAPPPPPPPPPTPNAPRPRKKSLREKPSGKKPLRKINSRKKAPSKFIRVTLYRIVSDLFIVFYH